MKGYKLKGFGRNHVIPSDNKPISIIITLPVKFLIDLCEVTCKREGQILRGFKECIRQIETLKNDPDAYWTHSMGNKPVDDERIQFAYINILNKIRYKAKVIGFEPGGIKMFNDGRKRTAKHWLLLHEFEKIPEIKMGGFQGFRYWNDDYVKKQPINVNKKFKNFIEKEKMELEILKEELSRLTENNFFNS